MIRIYKDGKWENIEVSTLCNKFINSVDISVDGASKTGIGIYDGKNIAVARIEKRKGEDIVEYKLRLKEFLLRIITNLNKIRRIIYEEPFIGYAHSSDFLYQLKSLIKEIKLENDFKFDIVEVSNMKWKKLFLSNEKVFGNTKIQKEKVKSMLSRIIEINGLSQDEIDALSIVISCYRYEKYELISLKKKKYKFEYLFGNGDKEDLSVLMEDRGIYQYSVIYDFNNLDEFKKYLMTIEEDIELPIVCVLPVKKVYKELLKSGKSIFNIDEKFVYVVYHGK